MSKNVSLEEEKQTSIAYLLWGLGFFGISGLHRIYLGNYGLGTAMLLTFGFCGVMQVIEIFTIPSAVEASNLGDSSSQEEPNSSNINIVDDKPVDNNENKLDDFDLEQASIDDILKKLKN